MQQSSSDELSEAKRAVTVKAPNCWKWPSCTQQVVLTGVWPVRAFKALFSPRSQPNKSFQNMCCVSSCNGNSPMSAVLTYFSIPMWTWFSILLKVAVSRKMGKRHRTFSLGFLEHAWFLIGYIFSFLILPPYSSTSMKNSLSLTHKDHFTVSWSDPTTRNNTRQHLAMKKENQTHLKPTSVGFLLTMNTASILKSQLIVLAMIWWHTSAHLHPCSRVRTAFTSQWILLLWEGA